MPANDDELLDKIRRRSIIYRLLWVAMVCLVVGGFLTTILVQNANTRQVLHGVQDQNLQLKNAVRELKRDANEKLDRQTKQLQCLANFFAQPNRADRIIANIDDCLISRDPSSTLFNQNPPQQSTQATPKQGSSSSPAALPPVASAPAPSNDTPPKDNEETPPPAADSTKPINVLGLPVCVLLLNICVEH